MTLSPPKPDVLLGVSDGGNTAEFNESSGPINKHPALTESII